MNYVEPYMTFCKVSCWVSGSNLIAKLKIIVNNYKFAFLNHKSNTNP